MEKKRCIKLLSVILSLCLLVLCLSPVIGCCHNCSDDDCVICRAVCAVSRLMKTAGVFSAIYALTLYINSARISGQKKAGTVTAPSPVELHTVILS